MKYYTNMFTPSRGMEQLPIGKPIWAVAYEINDDTKITNLRCLPTHGEITNYGRNYFFVPYKKGTNEKRRSGEVLFWSRRYADTYEEAVELYYEMIDDRIKKLQKMIEEAKADKLKVPSEVH